MCFVTGALNLHEVLILIQLNIESIIILHCKEIIITQNKVIRNYKISNFFYRI